MIDDEQEVPRQSETKVSFKLYVNEKAYLFIGLDKYECSFEKLQYLVDNLGGGVVKWTSAFPGTIAGETTLRCSKNTLRMLLSK